MTSCSSANDAFMHIMAVMRHLAYELFSVASRLLNVILGGSADMTFSARVYMDGWERGDAADGVAVSITTVSGIVITGCLNLRSI